MTIASSPGALAAPVAGAPVEAAPLRDNFAWTLLGNVVYAGCQWGILVVVARLASPAAVGQLALGYALTAPVFLLVGLQLRASQATDAARRFHFAEYRAVRAAGMGIGILATAALVALSGHAGGSGLVIMAVGASKAVEGLSDVYYGILQQHERMRPMAVSLVWRGILSVGAMAAALAAGGGLLAGVVAMTISWVAVLLLHDVRATAPLLAAAPRRPARVDLRAVREIVVTAAPLGLVAMLVSLRTNVPRYFVGGHLGAAELGVFAALSSLLTAGNVVISALGQAATPRLARHFHVGDVKGFRRLLALLLGVATIVGAGGILGALALGRPLLLALFGPPYAAQADVLVVLMGVGLVAYVASFLGYALTAARHFAVQLPLFVGTTGACAAGCASLVPAHGLAGAAAAWGASLFVEIVAVGALVEVALRRRAAGGLP